MSKKTILWIVVGIVAVGAIAFSLTSAAGPGGGSAGQGGYGASWPESADIDASQLKDFAAKGARLIDVRTPAEYQGGHIEGAVNVPVEDLTGASAEWDKTLPVVVYCQTGARSLNAQQYLIGRGFEHVYNLAGGIVTWDGEVVTGSPKETATGPATGKPVMYDFSSET